MDQHGEEDDEAARGARLGRRLRLLRRFTWWSFGYIVLLATALPVPDLAVRPLTSPQRIAVGLALLVFTVIHARGIYSGMAGLGRGGGRRGELALGGAIALGLWATMAPNSEIAIFWAAPAGAMAGVAAVTLPPQWRWRVSLGSAALVAAVAVVVSTSGGAGTVGLATAGAAAVLFVAGIDYSQAWLWDVALDLDHARRTTAALAVTQERLRIAAELHDIQGHNLQAIALTAELAQRLIGVDDHGARSHAAEAQRLARSALTDTRALVQGYRRVSFETELRNAVDILGAAGIAARVEGDPGLLPASMQPLNGLLVREATTNLLRHSNAGTCVVTVSREPTGVRVTVADDGDRIEDTALGPAADAGSGIASLQERFAARGGTLTAGPLDGGGFVLAGWTPLAGAAAPEGAAATEGPVAGDDRAAPEGAAAAEGTTARTEPR